MRFRSTFMLLGAAVAAAAVGGSSRGEAELPPSAPLASATGAVARVAPFLTQHCIGCHGPEKHKADLVLHVYKDDASVLKDRKKWEQVLQMVESGEMPPDSKPRPPAADVESFSNHLRGLFDKVDADKRDPGRVTMRRLNRVEYANTVRDLLALDINPAEDLPADDVGHGFDNIGDVLTLSPLLLERYLAASEIVVQRAFPADGNWAAPIRLLPNTLQPPAAPGKRKDLRFMTPGERLTNSFTVNADGDYLYRLKAYRIPGVPIPRAVLEVDGKPLKTYVIPGIGYANSLFYDVPVKLEKGKHTVGVYYEPPAGAEEAEKDAKAADEKPAPAAEKVADAANAEKSAGDKKADEAKSDAPPAKPEAASLTPNWSMREDPGLHVQWQEVARSLGPTAAQKLVTTHADGLSPPDAAKEVVGRFASRAFRRPATAAEVDRLVKLADDATADGAPWDAGVRLAVQAVLVSPKFLFRAELDDRPDSPQAHPLGDYQLASRLSYFLWSTMPDEELFALAAKGELHSNLEAQVARMLKDPKSKALTENFAAQWLHIRLLKNVNPDAKVFSFDEPLRQAMGQETQLFFDAVVKEDRSILDLIDADFTFLNARLAKHYGIVDTKGNREGQEVKEKGDSIRGTKFVRVQLQPGERGGVLTQASVLTVTSNPGRTSPVKRGKFILEQILGTPPPPPPPDVPALPEGDKVDASAPVRKRLEQHRADTACANCHARMDPIGFAFENFDAVGRWRTKDGEFDIDPSGTLPSGQALGGAGDLKKMLKGKADVFARCLAEKMMVYALGRGLEYSDRPAVNRVVKGLSEKNYQFSALVTQIVESDPFRLRRGKDQHDE